MENNTHEINNSVKLLQDRPPLSFGVSPRKEPCNNKPIKRIADPHIEAGKRKGKNYYYYRRGVDAPIYLGTADSILKAVQLAKLATGKNWDS